SQPHQLLTVLFEMLVEFAKASFGKQNFSLESGRDDAFVWRSITRVGREAGQLALQRLGTEVATGLSSPRRYLWDEESYTPGWLFSSTPGNLM
ncbi:virulence factor SrfB, partial [Erwinia amylovora]|uniref:virulence factor SrfB n=1 Tax=Erwinia amylovora TaxID=552 RepID=UPI0020C1272C